MPQVLNSYELTVGDIENLRRTYLRDLYKSMPYIALCPYNALKKQNFISDLDLQTICNRIVVDQQEELEAAWEEKANERLRHGFGSGASLYATGDVDDYSDTEQRAAEQGDLIQKDILFKLITSEVFKLMLRDADYRQSLFLPGSGMSGNDVMKQMQDTIDEFAEWTSGREGEYGFITLERY